MANGDLTTLDAVKGWLKISGSADDAVIVRLISQCSAAVANYTNRSLLSQSYTEKYDGNSSSVLMLRQSPITAVSCLTLNGVDIAPSPDGILQDGYTFDATRLLLINRRFWRGQQNVAITYTAGYATVPGDVEEAVIEFVSDRLRLASRLGEKTKSLPQGGSVSYEMQFMSARVKGSLSNYRRLIPI